MEAETKSGYKMTEAGLIPIDWGVAELFSICDVRDGTHDSPRYYKSGIKFVTSKNIINGNLDFTDISYISIKDAIEINKRSKVEKGDILMSMIGTIGNAVLISYEPDFCIKNVALIKPNFINGEFLIQLIYSSFYQTYIKNNLDGGIQKFISLGVLRSLECILPPLPEQTAIANALKDTDYLINSLENLIAKKKLIKQGAMQELLKPKDGWVKKKLGEVLKVKHGRSQKEIEVPDGIFPILGSGGIMGYTNQFLYNKPSVLIGRKGTIDKPQFLEKPFWTVDTLFYTEIFENYDAKYVFYVFTMIDWYSYNEASGVPSLNAKTIELIDVNFPKTKTEQSEISYKLTDLDNDIFKLQNKLEKSRKIKQGMMQQLLTGKIRLV
jgi:type I restriction enzyme S subunit